MFTKQLLFFIVFTLFTGCSLIRTTRDALFTYENSIKPKKPEVEKAIEHYHEIEKRKDIFNNRNVHLQAENYVELPPATDSDQAKKLLQYDFYVWIDVDKYIENLRDYVDRNENNKDTSTEELFEQRKKLLERLSNKNSVASQSPTAAEDSKQKSKTTNLHLLLESGELQANVIGVRNAKIQVVKHEKDYNNQYENVIQITVSSEDIKNKPHFSILAWFPQWTKDYEKRTAEYIASYQKRIIELKRNIEELKLSDDDVKKLSRVENTKYANLSARLRTEAKLDEKVKDLLKYRKTIYNLTQEINTLQKKLNPWRDYKKITVFGGDLRTQIVKLSREEVEDAFGETFAKYFHVGRVYIRNTHTTKKLVVYTTSLRTRCLFYREPNLNRINDEFIDNLEDLLIQLDVDRINAYSYETSTGIGRETLAELTRLIITSPPSTEDSELGKFVEKNFSIKKDDKSQQFEQLKKIAKFALWTKDQKIKAIYNEILVRLDGLKIDQNTILRQDINSKKNIFDKEYNADYDSKGIPQDKTNDVRDLIYTSQEKFHSDILDEIIKQYMTKAVEGSSSAIRSPLPLRVNLNRSPALFSEDTSFQARMAKHGYVWEGYYRPMTFRAVLGSLVATTKKNPNEQIIRFLRLAGIAIGAIAPLVDSQGFAEAAAVFTGVVVPEFSELLRENLEDYIKNLESLSMDSVVEIPPRGVVDKYIFFPRGPIFGLGVDEYTIDKPSFLVEVDSNDVPLEGILVEKDIQISSGFPTASELVGQAINKGRNVRNEEDEQMIRMTGRLRDYLLTVIPQRVKELIDEKKYLDAQREIARYTSIFGNDGLGIIDGLKSDIAKAQGQNYLTATSLLQINIQKNGEAYEGKTTYSVKLSRRPEEDVQVNIAPSSSASRISFRKDGQVITQLTFSSENWNQEQIVEVTFKFNTFEDLPNIANNTEIGLQHTSASKDLTMTGLRQLIKLRVKKNVFMKLVEGTTIEAQKTAREASSKTLKVLFSEKLNRKKLQVQIGNLQPETIVLENTISQSIKVKLDASLTEKDYSVMFKLVNFERPLVEPRLATLRLKETWRINLIDSNDKNLEDKSDIFISKNDIFKYQVKIHEELTGENKVSVKISIKPANEILKLKTADSTEFQSAPITLQYDTGENNQRTRDIQIQLVGNLDRAQDETYKIVHEITHPGNRSEVKELIIKQDLKFVNDDGSSLAKSANLPFGKKLLIKLEKPTDLAENIEYSYQLSHDDEVYANNENISEKLNLQELLQKVFTQEPNLNEENYILALTKKDSSHGNWRYNQDIKLEIKVIPVKFIVHNNSITTEPTITGDQPIEVSYKILNDSGDTTQDTRKFILSSTNNSKLISELLVDIAASNPATTYKIKIESVEPRWIFSSMEIPVIK